MGWLADRKVPTPLRGFVYRSYARVTGADLGEIRLGLDGYASLSAFFVRQLKEGARPLPEDPGLLPCPVDGTVQDVARVREGSLLQAKGRPYALGELLAGVGEDLELEGAQAWTVYLSPRDYHRIHAPLDCELVEVAWAAGSRYSVAPAVLERRERVLSVNERAVLRFRSERGPFLLVLVGALNVGRIRVVGVPPGGSPPSPRAIPRGEEIGRFEMGSTIVLIWPAGAVEPLELPAGTPLKLGQPLGRFS